MVRNRSGTDKLMRLKREKLEIIAELFEKNYPNLRASARDDAKKVNYILDEWIKLESRQLVVRSFADAKLSKKVK